MTVLYRHYSKYFVCIWTFNFDPSSIPGSGISAEEGIGYLLQYSWASFVGQLIKESTCSVGVLGSIPGLGRSPGEGKGYPLQYPGLENSMDCIVHGLAKSVKVSHPLPQRLVVICLLTHHWIDTVAISILQMRRLRHRELKLLKDSTLKQHGPQVVQ